MLAWYALRVRSHFEKKVAEVGRSKGYEGFLPLYQRLRRWSDRVKWIEIPLFPGYVFFRMDWANRLPLLTIGGSLHFIGDSHNPVPIDESEINAIRDVLKSDVTFGPWPFLESGHRVQLRSGPLAGLEGFLIKSPKGTGIVISMNILQRSVVIDIEPKWLHLMPTRKAAVALH